MQHVDLAFPVRSEPPGGELPADHAWPLFGAVSRIVPPVHGDNGSTGPFGLHPIPGRQTGSRRLRLTDSSRLTIRTPAERIGELLPLAGVGLEIAGTSLRCGPPEVRPLLPAASLRSRLVTIKLRETPVDEERFRTAVRRQLDVLGVSSDVRTELPPRRSWSGEERPARRTLRVKGREIIGYEVRLHGLSAEESLLVQAKGIGGRRALGCGLFVGFEGSEESTDD